MIAPTVSSFVHIVFLILAVSNLPTPASSALTVEPVHQAIEVGESAEFVCTRRDKGSPEEIVWTLNNDIDIRSATTNATTTTSDNLQRARATNVNGTLKIRNATETDKGWYVCSVVVDTDTGKSDKHKVQLVVYVMPEYTEELVGLGVACLALAVIVATLYVHKAKTETKRMTTADPPKMPKVTTLHGHVNASTAADTEVEVFSARKGEKREFEF